MIANALALVGASHSLEYCDNAPGTRRCESAQGDICVANEQSLQQFLLAPYVDGCWPLSIFCQVLTHHVYRTRFSIDKRWIAQGRSNGRSYGHF